MGTRLQEATVDSAQGNLEKDDELLELWWAADHAVKVEDD